MLMTAVVLDGLVVPVVLAVLVVPAVLPVLRAVLVAVLRAVLDVLAVLAVAAVVTVPAVVGGGHSQRSAVLPLPSDGRLGHPSSAAGQGHVVPAPDRYLRLGAVGVHDLRRLCAAGRQTSGEDFVFYSSV